MSFFVAETRETERRLTSSTMFLGQIDGEFVDYFAGVSGESAKETAVTVHDDKTETGVILEKFVECFGVKFVVAKVKRCIDWFERLKVNIKFSLFAFVRDNFPMPLESAVTDLRFGIYPQNITSPLGGTRLYNFSLCWVEVIAPKTDNLFTRDLILDAVPYSSASSFWTRGI